MRKLERASVNAVVESKMYVRVRMRLEKEKCEWVLQEDMKSAADTRKRKNGEDKESKKHVLMTERECVRQGRCNFCV